MRKPLILVLYLLLNLHLFAHPGRTDANGGHIDKKTGEYHFHNNNSGKRGRSKPAQKKLQLKPSKDVYFLQASLNLLKYKVGKIDGHMGYTTRQALIKFQKDYDLPATGRFNKKTKCRLLKELENKFNCNN